MNEILVPQWRIETWFPDLKPAQVAQLKIYFNELIKFNKVVNLVSAKSLLNADSVHFADCILSSRIVQNKINKNEHLYDLGSGNGFPGLVYSILFPEQKVILMDSDERKCEFLKHMVETLKLMNTSIQNKKIDRLPDNTISQAICRGFAPLPKALLMLRKIVKRNGLIFHLKSSDWSMEVSQIPSQLCSVWQPVLEGQYVLPESDVRMYVVRTDKIN